MQINNNNLKVLSDYFILFLDGIPDIVYYLAGIFLIMTVLVFAVSVSRPQFAGYGWHFILFYYLSVLIYYTLIARGADDVVGLNMKPLWSYQAILNGNSYLVIENIFNVLLFIPIGGIIGVRGKYTSLKYVLVWCVVISFSIEILQYLMKRGFAETDDIIHNMLGGIIGYGFYLFCSRLLKRF